MPKQSGQIIGAFILRNEGDGCLTSKYFHSDSSEGPFTEACKLIESGNNADPFIGIFRTVWLEDGGRHVHAKLKIERQSSNSNLYSLIWYIGDEAKVEFTGTAMNFDGLLVGTYWD